MSYGVGCAGVFRELISVDIEPPGGHVDGHVFQDGAEAPCGLEDFRLLLTRESNHLGVASSLEIEDPPIATSVLVVSDLKLFGISRQGRLAGAGNPEEKGQVVPVFSVVTIRVNESPRRSRVEEAKLYNLFATPLVETARAPTYVPNTEVMWRFCR
jgi:hypothetical protein